MTEAERRERISLLKWQRNICRLSIDLERHYSPAARGGSLDGRFAYQSAMRGRVRRRNRLMEIEGELRQLQAERVR